MQSVNAKPGFTSLFNGKDLTGWVGDPDLWKVEDSILVGRTTKNLSYNDFLRTEKEYANFAFTCETRLQGYNSGIQFRSLVQEDGHMAGYQADIGDGCWGALYEEMLRGHLVHYQPEIVESILNENDWQPDCSIRPKAHTLKLFNECGSQKK